MSVFLYGNALHGGGSVSKQIFSIVLFGINQLMTWEVLNDLQISRM
mgnify:FL=1|jgi:hypothetical protein